ncbi:MAG: hypothetical protein BMS9Abin29_0528 [Gemmatimonadota bacterium]|nr:MAG: hypothetical protein BMS9Abin29_0528 [Gemmatimonadota bacterium]
MKRLFPFLAIAALMATPPSVQGQGFAVTGQAGTLGLGGGAVIGLTDKVHLRGTFDFFPYEPEVDFSDITFAIELPTTVRLLVDLYPVGSFRLTGGVLIQGDVNVTGEPGPQQIGGMTYTGAEVGTLTGNMSFNTALYGGIGFGNPIGKRVGVNLDLGIGVRSEPDVTLSATGTATNNATFQSDLRQEESEIQNDASLLRYYPVISLAISIGLGM